MHRCPRRSSRNLLRHCLVSPLAPAAMAEEAAARVAGVVPNRMAGAAQLPKAEAARVEAFCRSVAAGAEPLAAPEAAGKQQRAAGTRVQGMCRKRD